MQIDLSIGFYKKYKKFIFESLEKENLYDFLELYRFMNL